MLSMDRAAWWEEWNQWAWIHTHTFSFSPSLPFPLSSKMKIQRGKRIEYSGKVEQLQNNTHIRGLPFIWNSRKGKLQWLKAAQWPPVTSQRGQTVEGQKETLGGGGSVFCHKWDNGYTCQNSNCKCKVGELYCLQIIL